MGPTERPQPLPARSAVSAGTAMTSRSNDRDLHNSP